MRVEFHPAAVREIEAAQAWYEQRSLLAASAFLGEFSAAVQRIRKTPLRYAEAEANTRRALLDRFPFTIYYRVRPDRPEVVWVVAVAHQKRRPGYWASR
ncbi:MAG: type II toxin-antitoxin system RelE/ParE family toxin [bacterium]